MTHKGAKNTREFPKVTCYKQLICYWCTFWFVFCRRDGVTVRGSWRCCQVWAGVHHLGEQLIYVFCYYKNIKCFPHWDTTSSVNIYPIRSNQNLFKPCEQLIWRSLHCWTPTDWTFCLQTNVCKPAERRHTVRGTREKMQKIFWHFSPNFFLVLIPPDCAALIRHRWPQGSPHCLACCLGRPQCLSNKNMALYII